MININFIKDSIMFKKTVKMLHLLTSNSHDIALLFYESNIFGLSDGNCLNFNRCFNGFNYFNHICLIVKP